MGGDGASIPAMRAARSLVIYLAAVFVGGALLAPWIYFGAGELAPHSRVAAEPFHRFMDRTLLGVALAGLWPLLGANGMRSWRQLGLVGLGPRRGELAGGFFLGWGALLAAFVPAILCRARLPMFDFHNAGGYVTSSVLTAMVVSVVEEVLFRGALFGLLRQSMDWRLAALGSGVVYALAHFLRKAELAGAVTWFSGLQLLPPMARALVDAHTLFPAVLNLTVIGVALAILYERTGALYASMGLHASLIFWLRFFQFLTAPAPAARGWLWGRTDPLSGWLALPILAAMACLAARARWGKSNG